MKTVGIAVQAEGTHVHTTIKCVYMVGITLKFYVYFHLRVSEESARTSSLWSGFSNDAFLGKTCHKLWIILAKSVVPYIRIGTGGGNTVYFHIHLWNVLKCVSVSDRRNSWLVDIFSSLLAAMLGMRINTYLITCGFLCQVRHSSMVLSFSCNQHQTQALREPTPLVRNAAVCSLDAI